jgi:hypothetical protein
MIISFLVSSIAGIIISKFGNLNITVVGNVIGTTGFFLLFMFHSTQILISINLGIIAIGLSFSRVGGYNIVAASAPEQYSGVAYGMTVLLFYIGMAIGLISCRYVIRIINKRLPLYSCKFAGMLL